MDTNTAVYNSEIKVFLNHVYEFQKGVRRMILYTTAKKNCRSCCKDWKAAI